MTECTDGLDYQFSRFYVDLDYTNLNRRNGRNGRNGNIYTFNLKYDDGVAKEVSRLSQY